MHDERSREKKRESSVRVKRPAELKWCVFANTIRQMYTHTHTHTHTHAGMCMSAY